MIGSLFVRNHFLDQVNLVLKCCLVCGITFSCGGHFAQSLVFSKISLASGLVEAVPLVERAVAEGRGVILSGASVSHLPENSSVNQTVRLVGLHNDAVLIISNGLGVEVVLDSAAFPKFVVAWVLLLFRWQQGLAPINDRIFSFNGLLTVEVEYFIVGFHTEFVRRSSLFV